ncbi:MAG: AmmeMemoRadiSam system protein B [bacterium]|nr:AmmeMemoRadiSam system protein B [bacterium]
MNRWTLALGLLASGYFVWQINTGELLVNDAFRMLELENEAVVDPDADIIAAIVSPSSGNLKELANFFSNLSKTKDIETFIILGENHSRGGRYRIGFSEHDYETDFGVLKINDELQEEILAFDELKLGTSFWAFHEEKSISVLAAFVKKFFPEARIVPIVLKDSPKTEDLEIFAKHLSEINDDGVFLLGATAFSQEMPFLVREFHMELTKNVFENFDFNGIAQMDVDSRPVVFTVMKYLEEFGAEEVEFSGETFIFREGDALSQDRDLTILAFGDIMLGRYVRTLMDKAGSKGYVFENVRGYEGRFFEGADIVHANLEGPIKGVGKKGGTAMSFAFNEDIAPFLKNVGFNLLSIANNHAVDQGWEGRDTTISALNKAGLSWCGHPSEVDPLSVSYKWVGDKKVAFLCFQDITHKLDDDAALKLISQVKKTSDYLIVSVHWGIEYKQRADYSTQVEPGHAFIDAGADFVIGHHPHVVENFEIYKGKFIFYSLGNFVFDQYWSIMTQEELAIGIVLDDDDDGEGLRTKVYLFPMKSDHSQSRLMNEEERSAWTEDFLLYGDYSDELKKQIRAGVVEY